MKRARHKRLTRRQIALALPAVGAVVSSAVMGGAVHASDVGVIVDLDSEISISTTDTNSYDFELAQGSKTKFTKTYSVLSNSQTGFTLSFNGTSGKTTLTNSGWSDSKFSSIASTSTLSNFSGNVWGYSIDSNYTSDDLSFSPIPSSASTIDTTSSTSKDYPLTIGVGADALKAGAYSGSVTLTATVQTAPASYVLIYDDNYNGGSGAFLMEQVADSSATHSFTITSQTPTRDGYTFLGWSTSSSASTATYVAGDTYTVAASSPTQTLYAVWSFNNSNSLTLTTSPSPSLATSGSSDNTDSDNGTTSSGSSSSSNTATDPLGTIVDSSSSFDIDVKSAVLLGVGVAATVGFFLVLLVDRKDEEEDTNQPTE